MRTRTVAWIVAISLSLLAVALGPSAEAAPRPNPFAGAYSGEVPPLYSGGIDVASKNAKHAIVSGSWSAPGVSMTLSGTLSGSGRLQCEATLRTFDEDNGLVTRTASTTAWVHLDADGNVVGTTDAGQTFTWLRR